MYFKNFCNARDEMFTKSLPFTARVRVLLVVLWWDAMIKQMYPFISNNNKTLSYLELNYKRRIVIVLERFENRGVALEVYHRIFPRFS